MRLTLCLIGFGSVVLVRRLILTLCLVVRMVLITVGRPVLVIG